MRGGPRGPPALPGPRAARAASGSTPRATGTPARCELDRRAASRSRATVYRPDIGGLLPVYVADRYEGIEARPFPELVRRRARRATWSATSPPCARSPSASRPDVALANHLVMGPADPRAGARRHGVPYAVKVHGSALEYTVKPYPRFLPYAREGLARRARRARRLAPHRGEPVGGDGRPGAAPAARGSGRPASTSTRFAPREPAAARAGLERPARALAAADAPAADADSSFARDPARRPRALATIDPGATAWWSSSAS